MSVFRGAGASCRFSVTRSPAGTLGPAIAALTKPHLPQRDERGPRAFFVAHLRDVPGADDASASFFRFAVEAFELHPASAGRQPLMFSRRCRSPGRMFATGEERRELAARQGLRNGRGLLKTLSICSGRGLPAFACLASSWPPPPRPKGVPLVLMLRGCRIADEQFWKRGYPGFTGIVGKMPDRFAQHAT